MPCLLLTLLSLTTPPEHIDVYRAGQDGYHTYRIPSVIVTPKGTVLAFAEGRKGGRGDAGDIDLVLKRSRDGGKTWDQQLVVWDDGVNTCGNPCPVVDESTGTIWLLLTHNVGSDTEARLVAGTSTGSRTVWITKSTDDGLSWQKPMEITKSVKLPSWTWYATGPGIGIQLKLGKHAGRLIIPCDNKVAGSKVNQSHVIYSDDHGASWQLGGVVGPKCNESQIVELSNGSLLLNMRSAQANNRRFVAKSSDSGLTFTPPVEDAILIEPVCQASIIRIPGEPPRFLFANPASTKRERLTVRLSKDDCQTWSQGAVLHSGPAAYSCLTVLPDSWIGCLYERGRESPYESITFAVPDKLGRDFSHALRLAAPHQPQATVPNPQTRQNLTQTVVFLSDSGASPLTRDSHLH